MGGTNGMPGASDILQQALENSGLTSRVPENGQEASQTQTTTSGVSSVNTTQPRTTMTMTVHDAATGITKRHLIRKVRALLLQITLHTIYVYLNS